MAITFEDILPWGTTGGDTGLSARLKLKRNFEKIRLWTDAVPGLYQPKGSYVETEGDRMTGDLLMDNCQLQFGTIQTYIENSSDKLKLHGKEGILLDGNTFLGSGNALKSLEANADLIAYKSVDEGETINGVTVNHWFVGTGVQGVFRSNDPLVRYDGTDIFTIWDSSNLTPSNYLARTGGTLKGTLTFALPNGTHYGAIQTHTREDGEYLYLWGNDGVLIDGLSVRKDSAIVPIEDVFLNLTGGTMEPGATITLQEIENNIPVETLVASQRWVNAQGFLTSHQSLANYVTLDGTETITGQKTFGGIVNLQSDVYVTPTGTLYLQTYDSASRPVSSPAASQSWVSSQGFLTSHQSLADYATTSQLDNGLAAKQNKIHFLNKNNNDTESDFSYLYLPLMNVSGGNAELDCVTLSGLQTISGAKTIDNVLTVNGSNSATFALEVAGAIRANTGIRIGASQNDALMMDTSSVVYSKAVQSGGVTTAITSTLATFGWDNTDQSAQYGYLDFNHRPKVGGVDVALTSDLSGYATSSWVERNWLVKNMAVSPVAPPPADGRTYKVACNNLSLSNDGTINVSYALVKDKFLKADITDFAHTHMSSDISDLDLSDYALRSDVGSVVTGIGVDGDTIYCIYNDVDPHQAAAFVPVTVPFATRTMGFKGLNVTGSQIADANTMTVGGVECALLTNYASTNLWSNMPSGMSWGNVLQLTSASSLGGQLAWDSNHGVTTGVTRKLYWRSRNSTGWGTNGWHTIAFEDWVTTQLNTLGDNLQTYVTTQIAALEQRVSELERLLATK